MRTILAGVFAVVMAGSGANAEPGSNRSAGKQQADKQAHPAQSYPPQAKGKGGASAQAFSAHQKETHGNGKNDAQAHVASQSAYHASDKLPGNSEKRNKKAQQKQGASGKPEKARQAFRSTQREEVNDHRIDRVLVSDKKGPFRRSDARNHGLINGCPPGLELSEAVG